MTLISSSQTTGPVKTVQLEADLPEGRPSFRLTSDQIATVINLVCGAATDAALRVTPGMPEVPITRILRKSMRRLRVARGLTNLEVNGEVEIDDMARFDESLLGRIDLTLKFMHQFGDEDAFVSIECKRVGRGMTALNRLYVSEGVVRFATGRYAKGHPYGFMLGYVLAMPHAEVVEAVGERLLAEYGPAAAIEHVSDGGCLATARGRVPRVGGADIVLYHMFADMRTAL